MTIKHDKELVCAYLDNQLTVSEKIEFEKRLNEESDLQGLVEQFKQADTAYIRACKEDIPTPVPDQILSQLEPTASKHSHVPSPWLLAASFAVIAITTGLVFKQSNDEDIQIAIFKALDNTPSSEFIWLDDKQEISMLINLSFQHSNGQYCREFVLDKQGQASRNIACKDQQWRTIIEATAAPLYPNEGYLPAGDKQNNKIERYLDNAMQGDGLDHTQEQVLIDKKWLNN